MGKCEEHPSLLDNRYPIEVSDMWNALLITYKSIIAQGVSILLLM